VRVFGEEPRSARNPRPGFPSSTFSLFITTHFRRQRGTRVVQLARRALARSLARVSFVMYFYRFGRCGFVAGGFSLVVCVSISSTYGGFLARVGRFFSFLFDHSRFGATGRTPVTPPALLYSSRRLWSRAFDVSTFFRKQYHRLPWAKLQKCLNKSKLIIIAKQ
jgi:hypothetical protein